MKNQTTYHFIDIKGVNIFYREAGPKDAPTLVLLHGYPTSSHMLISYRTSII
jgi:pimeloyl-ACP methyl ester carboxylesterase